LAAQFIIWLAGKPLCVGERLLRDPAILVLLRIILAKKQKRKEVGKEKGGEIEDQRYSRDILEEKRTNNKSNTERLYTLHYNNGIVMLHYMIIMVKSGFLYVIFNF